MVEDDYLSDFLDSEELESEAPEELPSWVSDENLSLKAYRKIQELRLEKLLYIAKNSKKSDFKRVGRFTINQSEVAKSIGCAPQGLFSSTTSKYSGDLTEYLNKVNAELEEKKYLKIERKKRGLQNRSKEQLITEVKKQKNEAIMHFEKTAEDAFLLLKSEMPLDLKRKLGLK